MQTYRFPLHPLTAFGTPLAGDTLFGQLCWTLRHQLGNDGLNTLLNGYTQGRPFAVVSDALPAGHIPLPHVPSGLWAQASDTDRKALKKKRWLPVDQLTQSFAQWQSLAKTDGEVLRHGDKVAHRTLCSIHTQPHNTINRQIGTTGDGQFAPYAMPQLWLDAQTPLELIVVLDETRLTRDEFSAALQMMGHTGYGRDASIGLGKFDVAAPEAVTWPTPPQANSYLTLAPCAPQGQGFCPQRSTYQVMTRFGRHGDAAVQSGNPFKRPVLMARAGAVFFANTFDSTLCFIGNGFGGIEHPISNTMPETVQQGYAPVIPITRPVEAA